MSIFIRQLISTNNVKVTTNRLTTRILKNRPCLCYNHNLVHNEFQEVSLRYTNQRSLIHTSAFLNKVIPYILSDIGEGIKEVNVKEWFIKEGDVIEQFQNICEVQSDKASVTITSRFDGKVTKIYHKVDDIAQVGQPLIDVDIQDDSVSEEKPSTTVTANEKQDISSSETNNANHDKALATPAVRRIAMQNKLNLSDITSTGRGGRVLKEDILKHLNISSEDSNNVQKMKDAKPKFVPRPIKTTPAATTQLNEDKVVNITGFTKAMVKTMTASLKIPHFVYSDEIDVSELVAIRNSTKKTAADAGVKLTFMPFFIKAASLSLDKYPILNSSVDENCENITYKAAHNIGVAMDTPNGLVVPNIKNVQQKSILQIAAELNRLQQDGTNRTLKPDDLTGGTFSLSNIGIIGGTYTKPVILAPQVSIGALGKIQVLPRFDKDGNITKAHIICISWSADHRIIDGVTMANFSNKWKFYVENPSHLMLDL